MIQSNLVNLRLAYRALPASRQYAGIVRFFLERAASKIPMGSLHPGWCGYNSALGLRVNVSIDPLTATIAELSCYARSSRWRQTARRASHPDCMSIQRRKSASEGHESLDHVPYRPPHTLPCYRSWRLLLKSRNSRTGLLARATISCLPPILNRKQRMWAPSGNGSHLVKRTGPLQSD